MFLTDDKLRSVLEKAEPVHAVRLTRRLFASLCLQALRQGEDDPARILIPEEEIKQLLRDPHNAIMAALSAETLRKLCQQAMSHSNA
jgi:hypothetical protein